MEEKEVEQTSCLSPNTEKVVKNKVLAVIADSCQFCFMNDMCTRYGKPEACLRSDYTKHLIEEIKKMKL